MFDSGFSELLLIMVVALVVVGPERLPGLVRKVGYWVGRFRRYANTVRAEIERELNADELRGMLTRQEDEIRELRDMLRDTRDQMRTNADQIADEVRGVGGQSSEDAAHPPQAEAGEVPVVTHDETAQGHAGDEQVKPAEPDPAASHETAPEPAKPQTDATHDRKPE
ncbi:twin arginine-targeting protein translocase TatB [Acidihalobacter aeolianus]|uniref:Sec-independent protein translocase protein TatB n=1 Tax=Acidihalobacter aeolianus TaxID=2792603 RepID=A0A1D8KB45_9GAMM|nr:Sec-independent protein translocase protein TatB [Acidihalobacter aeolianus]AOV18175.1 twin arginine-targeting protein translocase TatB [Acidihalobacter aeolianus]